MNYFSHKEIIFSLSIPAYEIPVFGYKLGELRLEYNNIVETEIEKIIPLIDIKEFLVKNNIYTCTFRGKEDIKIVRILNELGFKFVGTYMTFCGLRQEFKEIKMKTDMEVGIASENDFEEILGLEENVFDYSTFQIDPLFNPKKTAHRNCVRIKSYFNNPLHKTFIIRIKGKLAGFIQFLVDNEHGVADCVNGAVASGFQGLFIGPKLYSDAFKLVYSFGINKIIGGYSNQNIAVAKLFTACNFKKIDHEIHLRLHIKERL